MAAGVIGSERCITASATAASASEAETATVKGGTGGRATRSGRWPRRCAVGIATSDIVVGYGYWDVTLVRLVTDSPRTSAGRSSVHTINSSGPKLGAHCWFFVWLDFLECEVP